MLCGNFFKDHKKYFRPVCIPDEDLDLTNKAGIAVGWGLTALEKFSQGTSCDFKEGVADSSAIPTKLKKINLKYEGVSRYPLGSFLSLDRIVNNEECYDFFDELRTTNCAGPQVFPVNLCASSGKAPFYSHLSLNGLVHSIGPHPPLHPVLNGPFYLLVPP